MVAELAYMGNGQAQVFYNENGGTPWHREGTPIDDYYTFEEAIEFLNYPLEKKPYAVPDWDSVDEEGKPQIYNPSRSAHYVWRPDTKTVLGTVGRDYQIVTNLEAFEILRPLVDAEHLKLETGGVLRAGADAWLMGRWDLSRFGRQAQEVFNKENDEILPYATVMANHSGRRGIMLGETSVRLVCANTMSMAERDLLNERKCKRWRVIPHYKGAKQKLAAAAQELFVGVVERFENIAKQYKLLSECHLREDQFSELVLDVVAKDPRRSKKFNPEAKLANVVVERALTKRREVRRLWTEGKGHTGEKNAWMAYNGCVEALDHNTELWPTRAGSWRTASLLDGQLATMKNQVLDNLVAHALSA